MTLRLIRPDEGDQDGHAAGAEDLLVKEITARLNHVPARRWLYLRVARRAFKKTKAGRSLMLSHAEYRLLSALTEWADRDLSNCFPGIRLIAKREGLNERYVKRLLASLTKKGWIRSRPLRCKGKRSTGRQFAIPAGALTPWADEWLGPRSFPKADLVGGQNGAQG